MTNPSTVAAPSGAVVFPEDEAIESPRLYVNCYMIDQAYGGPEEGGGWYTVGRPVESRLAENDVEAGDILAERRAFWDGHNEGRPELYSVISEGRYMVCLESHLARHFPEVKPHYE